MEDVDPEISGRIVRPEVERKEREEGVKKMIQWMKNEIETKQLDPATFAALAHFYVVSHQCQKGKDYNGIWDIQHLATY
jgi:hypothetical protein